MLFSFLSFLFQSVHEIYIDFKIISEQKQSLEYVFLLDHDISIVNRSIVNYFNILVDNYLFAIYTFERTTIHIQAHRKEKFYAETYRF